MLSAVEKVALGPVAEGAKASTQERATIDTIIEDFMLIIDLSFTQVSMKKQKTEEFFFIFSSFFNCVLLCVRTSDTVRTR